MPVPYFGPVVPSNEPYEKAVKYTIPLKSRWDGDSNSIRGLHLRAFVFSDTDKTVFSEGAATVDAGNTDFHMSPYTRAPLSHSIYQGMSIVGGTGYVKVTPTAQFKTFAVSVAPKNTTASSVSRISFGNGTVGAGSITFTKNGATAYYYTVAFSGLAGLYINGVSITTGANMYIPFPILIVADLTTSAVDLRFGNAYTDSDAAESMQFDHVAMLTKYTGVTPTALGLTDAQTYTNLYYRKSQASDFVDSAVQFGSASIVPNPESWPVVSSS
jgi:hypothetical protein